MDHFALSVMFISVLGFAGSALSQDFRVVAVDEAPGRTMNAETFPSANPDALKKYMPDGTAPASMSSFVLFAGDDIILIDTGLGTEVWTGKLTELGIQPEQIKLILITHFHGDHIGGLLDNANVRRFPHARVFSAEPEYNFWLLRERQPQGALFGRIRAAYGEDLATFKFEDEVFANSSVKIKALDASGHTPGHTVFLIESTQSGGQRLLIIGDLLHAAALQFPVPEACARFDMDPEKSVASRRRILDFAVAQNLPIAGMHFPPPSVGTVKKEGNGYAFELKE